MKRSSGVLLPVASLPSKYGIGCFDRCAYDFVDQLVKAGQSYWQILPMGPTGYGDSPYQAFSTFAGNPYFISPDDLVKKGYLTENDCIRAAEGTSGKEVHYDVLFQKRLGLLRKAYANSSIEADVSYQAFVQKNSDPSMPCLWQLKIISPEKVIWSGRTLLGFVRRRQWCLIETVCWKMLISINLFSMNFILNGRR